MEIKDTFQIYKLLMERIPFIGNTSEHADKILKA